MYEISQSDLPILNPSYPDSLYYGQFERTEEIDRRIYERTIATDVPLRPNFDPRPSTTRQTVLPIISATRNPPTRKYLEYNTNKVFSSIQRNGPVEGFLNNVNIESSLRNQYFGIQRGAIQSTYVPSSNSDLYKVSVPTKETEYKGAQPFPGLFQQETYQTTGNPELGAIGKNVFHNPTKQQLRDL
jgi:hypothetical protein